MTGLIAPSKGWLFKYLWAGVAGLFLLFLGIPCNGAPASTAAVKGLHVGSDFYAPSDAALNAARSSGFTRIFLSYLKVDANGDFFYNRTLIVQKGAYVGDSMWGMKLATLKTAPTGIDRIEMVLGGPEDSSLSHIKALLPSQPADASSVLYRNLIALKNATGIDAIQIDDSGLEDARTAVALGNLIARCGMRVTFFSRTARDHTARATSELGDKVDAAYVSCYEPDETPAWWVEAFGKRRVYPGVWGNIDAPSSTTVRMRNWKSSFGITGGFVWLNGHMPVDAPKWAESLKLGLDPVPTYRIANRNSGKSLDLTSGIMTNGAPMNQSRYSTKDHQRWLLVPTETGEYFKIVSATSGKCGSIALDSTTDGAQLWAWEYAGGDPSQQFELLPAGNGWVKIRNVRSGKVLEVAGGSMVDGAKVQQSTENGTPAQQWILRPDDETLLLSEDFEYPVAEGLRGQNGGTGWNGPWLDDLGSATKVSSEVVLDGTEGAISNLAAGLNWAHVFNHQRVGRYVDCSAGGIFGIHGYLDAKGRIGADGTTLYIGFLQRPRSTGLFYEFEFNRGTERIAGIGNDTQTTNVFLRAPGSTFTPLGPGSTNVNLYVVRIDFKPGNDDIRVYRNPGIAAEPQEPTATVPGAADLSFDRITMGAFVEDSAVWHTRIRMGSTWEDVFSGADTVPARPISSLTADDLFWKVKVSGQVVGGSGQMYYVFANGSVAQVYLTLATAFEAGDLIEASGIVYRSGKALTLLNGVARKVWHSPLPEPKPLDVLSATGDLAWGSVEGTLTDIKHTASGALLQMQVGYTPLVARLPSGNPSAAGWTPGSRLKATGILHRQEPSAVPGNSDKPSTELLLHSPGAVQLVALPPWWTLKRLMATVTVLAVGLVLTFLWITLLRRQVEHRTQQLQREISQRKRVEQERAIEEERSRISRDLHDELGSKLTQISMLATSMPSMKLTLESASDRLRVVAEKSRSMIVALDGVVWAVNPKNNNLSSLATYLAAYTEEFLGRTPITCRVDAPGSYPAKPIQPEVRNNVLLSVKEAINNAVRHGRPAQITLKLSVVDSSFEISIHDNGCGFDVAKHSRGNGLVNLRQRMQECGGQCEIESSIGGGTTVRLNVPLKGTLEA